MRIIFTGSGEFGRPSLAALLDARHEIASVYTQPDRPAGRGRQLTSTPIAKFALDHALPLIRTADLNAQRLPPADLMIVIAFGQKISPEAAARCRLGSVNLHASLLPKFRGAAPINWAIIRGETETGNSVIRLGRKMDAGDILAQSTLSVGKLETAGELHDRLAADGANLMLETVDQLEAGQVTEIAQDASQATLAPRLSRQLAVIDWTAPAVDVARKIRGLYPWPGCRVHLLDAAGADCADFTLVRAAVAEGEGPRWRPGEITAAGHIACGQDAVEILEVQPDGKRPMPLPDYRRGHIWMPGMKLEGIG
jgi:methionyl-tRNA formyltransferase